MNADVYFPFNDIIAFSYVFICNCNIELIVTFDAV
ncbi:hypothetical protein ECH_0083 [Ehrlichia chaffeensis str. Arkansas]|uniref:Uncharacterized protein n=1 Tax=Ehrlichia chaffeensis (strain ATCC CRL-10679 / Arkansas) TaxID=205920 RepID=Q2GI20_EHRCR|nr:hypothetical protein ECH_0083 [Ehrlichia chaffeensis str. Arkansas]